MAAYFDAIARGDVAEVGRLLREDPGLLAARGGPDHALERGLRFTGLHLAIQRDRTEVALFLIEAGVDLEARSSEGRTALHDSIELGRTRVRDELLARGGEVDVCSAAILGRLGRLREWLEADPELANDRSTGLSPLGWAAFGNAVDTATELIDRGARMDDHELLCAASVGHVEVGRLLIARGADPGALGPEAGANALHAAVAMRYAHDSLEFVRMLIEEGVDLDARTARGKTALEIAEQQTRAQEERLAKNLGEHTKNYAGLAALLRASARV